MKKTLVILLFAFFSTILVIPEPSPQTGKVQLSWDANTESDLAGYVVYWGTNSGNYMYETNVGLSTSVIIGDLVRGRVYYYAVKAYNTSLLYSPFSNEVNNAERILPLTPNDFRQFIYE